MQSIKPRTSGASTRESKLCDFIGIITGYCHISAPHLRNQIPCFPPKMKLVVTNDVPKNGLEQFLILNFFPLWDSLPQQLRLLSLLTTAFKHEV